MQRRTLLAAAPATLVFGGLAAAPAQAAGRGVEGGGIGADGQDILNALARWSLGYDTRDVPLMRAAFTDDASFTFHLPNGGPTLQFDGTAAVMKLFTDSLAAQHDVRRHVTTNALVERVDRGRATVTSYLTLIIIDAGALRVQATGIYRDRVVRGGDGVWRIEHRDLTLDIPS